MSALLDRLLEDIKSAMKARDQRTLGLLRMLHADLKNQRIHLRHDLSDQEVEQVLGRAVKQRRDSVEQYTAAGRQELAEQEAWEIEVIQRYLPTPLSAAELAALVDAAIAELPEGERANLGKVMRAAMARVQGRADGKVVNTLVRERLG
jgi:uncharacterized protein YqeY